MPIDMETGKSTDPKHTTTIRVAAGSDGIKAGALRVLQAFSDELKQKAIPPDTHVHLTKSGTLGLGGHDVLVRIECDGASHLYGNIAPDMAERLTAEHVIAGNPVTEWLLDDVAETFHARQNRLLTSGWARIDPDDVTTYVREGGYAAVRWALNQSPLAIINELKLSGLRDVAAEGYPVFLRWQEVRKRLGGNAVIYAMADDGDPHSFIARDILESSPHSVIEGMIIAAHVLGAGTGVIVIRESYELASTRIRNAISEARREGFLGAGIMGSDCGFDIEVVSDTPENICAVHLPSPLANVQSGLPPDVPHLVHHVETWIIVQAIMDRASSENRRGAGRSLTKLLWLSGNLRRPGLVEVDFGTSLKNVIYDIGGFIPSFEVPRMVQVGGPIGGLLSPDFLEQHLDFENLAEADASFGSGAVRVLESETCVVAQAIENVYAYQAESCSQCVTEECREQINLILRLLIEIIESKGTREHVPTLQQLCTEMHDRQSCGSGRSAASYVLSTLRHFTGEYTTHALEKRCPTHQCFALTGAPCQKTCPAGIDIPSYLALVGHGRHEEAVEIIRKDNPFVWTCGLICPAPCERVCVRGEMDQPISIRAMKGFAAAMGFDAYEKKRPSAPRPAGPKVAVVGSGPGGLSCAYFLTHKGYQVTIFEALPEAGGLLLTGIPEYRLPKDIVRREIAHIQSLGVELRTGVRVGKDVTIDSLRHDGFQAFFIGSGAQAGYRLGIEGEQDFKGVYDSISFLRDASLKGHAKPADKVVVVGGGNAAVDAARTCVRLGCSRVIMAYRRTREEMPAWEEEIEQALEEKVEIRFLTIPVRVVGENGEVTGLECLEATLGQPDASGRRRPIPKAGSNLVIETGAVITAIGQAPDLTVLSGLSGIGVSRRKNIEVNPFSQQTSEADIFAGGDVVTGPATVVEAIGAGKSAARAIDLYLRGERMPTSGMEKKPRARIEHLRTTAEEKNSLRRTAVPLAPLEERIRSFTQVERGLTPEMAMNEAKRCLRCDMCAGQGLCQMVCREMGIGALQMTPTTQGRRIFTDFLKPGDLCIGCGSCTTVCPTGNIWTEEEGSVRRIYCGGALVRELEMEECSMCRKPLAPKEYLDHLDKKIQGVDGSYRRRDLCEDCVRKVRARQMFGGVLR